MESVTVTLPIGSLFGKYVKPKKKHIKIPVDDYVNMSKNVQDNVDEIITAYQTHKTGNDHLRIELEKEQKKYKFLHQEFNNLVDQLNRTAEQLMKTETELKQEKARPGKITKDEKKELKELRALQHKREKKVENTPEYISLNERFENLRRMHKNLEDANYSLYCDWRKHVETMDILAQAVTRIIEYKDKEAENDKG